MKGRPSSLTPEVHIAFIEGLNELGVMKAAAHRAAVAYSTIKLWLHKGRENPASSYNAFAREVDDILTQQKAHRLAPPLRTTQPPAPSEAEKANKPGPIPIAIDAKTVEAMAWAGSPPHEIAEYFGVDKKTIMNRFSPLIKKYRADRKFRLRRLQWSIAEGEPASYDAAGNIIVAEKPRNASMAMFLGKVYLHQRDHSVLNVKATETPRGAGILSPEERKRELEALFKEVFGDDSEKGTLS